jgi:DNA-directed RNA polymerase subunit RPC12/RpoP
MPLHEREFYHERPEEGPARFTCPRCGHRDEYQVRWIRRTKKPKLPPGADERDWAMFPKLRDYLVRVDDMVVCRKCRRRFDIPSHQSLVFI